MLARPGLPSFDYVRAATAEQVVGLLQEHGGTVRLLMGGTDLFPRMREGSSPKLIVDVKQIRGMQEIRYDEHTGLSVGAAVSLNALAGHEEVLARYPLLAEAAQTVASYQIRNRATLGGNLCNASPAADTAPAVLVLDGRIVLFGRNGTREVLAGDFFLGPGRTAMRADELMITARFPIPAAFGAGTYLKLGRNRGGDLAIAGVAVYGFEDRAALAGYRFRIALASVAPVPLRAFEAENILAAGLPVEANFVRAADKAAEAASPIDDVRASAAYRRAMVRALTLRGVRQVWLHLQTCRAAAAQP